MEVKKVTSDRRVKTKFKSSEYVDSDSSDSDFQECEKSISGDNTANKKIEKKTVKCDKCDYTSSKSNVNKHKSTHEQQKSHQVRSLACPQGNCKETFTTLDGMDEHLEEDHGRVIEHESLILPGKDALLIWLNELRSKQAMKYVLRGNKNRKTTFYYCHRSSQSQKPSISSGRRNPKKIGSIKCGKLCTSRIKVIEQRDGPHVKFIKTHSGHSINPGFVGLISTQKEDIATQLKDGVPKHKVLEKIQAKCQSEINRLGLSNIKDIDNVAKKFKINSDIKLDENDATSVDATIKRLELDGDNGVFLYKPQKRKELDEYPSLKKEDFVLAYMSNAQETLLKTHGTNIICIDGTHGTNAYGFELSTLITIDDQEQGFPNVFLFHSSKSQETYEIMFKKLKDRVGAIQCKVFMSDDEPAFYNAWLNVMGNSEKRLLCTWHVLRNWNKNLAGLDKDLRKTTWRKLRAIMQELDIVTFEDALKKFLAQIKDQPGLEKFHNYFVSYYLHRKDTWAHCYRVHAGINTNMHLERMHREIKYLYLNAKKTKRLDISFSAVRKFLRDKQYDRLISIFSTKLTTKDKTLRSRHNTSMDTDVPVYPIADYWVIPSCTKTQDGKTYTIRQAKESCRCSLICPQCHVCIHKYQCSCPDNSIQNNMCKHIHRLCRYLNENVEESDCSSDEEEVSLVIDTTQEEEVRYEEVQVHMADLGNQERNLHEDMLDQAKSLCSSLLQEADTKEALKIFCDGLKTTLGQVCCYKAQHSNAFQVPPTAEKTSKIWIEKQARFTPKKRKTADDIDGESNDEIIASLLLKDKFYPQDNTDL